MRAVIGMLLVIWTALGAAIGAYALSIAYQLSRTPGSYDIVSKTDPVVAVQGPTLLADFLLIWLGVLVALAALMVTSPSRRDY